MPNSNGMRIENKMFLVKDSVRQDVSMPLIQGLQSCSK